MRILVIFSSLACVTLTAVGLYSYYAERSQPPGSRDANLVVRVSNPAIVLGTVPVKDEILVDFVLVNPTAQTVPVVGLTGRCTFDGCIGPLDQEPFEMLPHSEHKIPCNVKLRRPGPFRVGFEFYVNDGELRSLDVSVTGTAAGGVATAQH